MQLRPGGTLGRYELIEQVGSGGMGVVWKARDGRLGRIVALKVLHAFGADRTLIAGFEREARALALAQHPAIVTIYTVEEADGVPFLTMEYVAGQPLSRHVPDGGLPLGQFYDLALPLAGAIGAAHSQGITHRDLKPGNILVTEAGSVKVLDFGLAAMFREDGDADTSPLTRSDSQDGGVHGTPPFMSPEQVMGRRVDHRSDLFSLGGILYFMLTGREPFPGDTAGEVFAAILRDSPPAVRSFRPEASESIELTIQQCLAKEPYRRPESAADVARALSVARDAEPLAERPVRSIAVLPFDDLSPEKDQDYLCEGIAEEIILSLTRIEGMQVASRSAAFLARATIQDRQALAARLNVQTLLEGTVRKSGPRLRIGVELVDVSTGFNLWTERYDRDVQDIFAIQDEIAGRVAEALRGSLTALERTKLRDRPTPHVHAYDLYLRGRKFYSQYSRKGMSFALSMFQRALEMDPDYARAHAGLAQCHAYLYMYGGAHPEDCAKADAASRRAIELGPESAEAHGARGLALALQHRAEEADAEFHEAIRLNPELFDAHYFAARSCFAAGRFAAAVELWEKAAALRPDDYQSPLLVAQAYEQLGDPRRAEAARRSGVARAEEHLTLHPDDVRALYMGANGLVALGQTEKGLAWAKQALALEPGEGMLLYNVGCIYALARMSDQALDCLEQAVEKGIVQREWYANDCNLDILRGHPRFQRLMASLGGGTAV
ncbi:MAG TPA: protein kinase [Vicinamibacterales bacterium]|nr:protein kinase [Vicinamibacterales bacterium]